MGMLLKQEFTADKLNDLRIIKTQFIEYYQDKYKCSISILSENYVKITAFKPYKYKLILQFTTIKEALK